MAMGRRIINEFSCILIVFVILAVTTTNLNCEASNVRHLLQAELVDSASKTLTNVSITVIDVGALVGILNVAGEDNLIFFFLNSTQDGFGGSNGFLILSRTGTLAGSLIAIGPLHNFTLDGILSNGTTNGSTNGMLISVGKISGLLTLGTDGTVNLSVKAVGPFNLTLGGTLNENGVSGSGSFGTLTFNGNGTLIGSGVIDGVGMWNATLNGTRNGSVSGTLVGVGTASLTYLPVNVTITPTLV